MENREILTGLYNAIVELNPENAQGLAEELVKTNIDILEAVENWMAPGMEKIGEKFQKGEVFLPELALSAHVFQKAMNVFEPKLLEGRKKLKSKGDVLVGTVKGDLHSIGKDLVVAVLKASSFNVIDLGVDVPGDTFIDEAEKSHVDIIALSALLTTTLPEQREVINLLEKRDLRQRYRVIIGGAPTSEEWSHQIGADGYGATAFDAVSLAKTFCDSNA